jgi:hypothetical protein
MPRLKNPESILATVVGVRLTAEEAARLDAVVASIPIATRHKVARAALLYGLAAIERDSGLLLRAPGAREQKPKAKKVARRRAS